MSYFPVRSKGMWAIEKDTPGPMPRQLSGMYTDEYKAKTAIQMFVAAAEEKRIQNMPAAQKRKAQAAKQQKQLED